MNESILDIGADPRLYWFVINHTMIVSFTEPIPDAELDQFLADIEALMRDSGGVESITSRHHIRVPADDHSPVFAASAIVRFDFADIDTLNASFTTPGIEDLIQRWQSRYPYRVVWANHEVF